jgi:hypothetical protein
MNKILVAILLVLPFCTFSQGRNEINKQIDSVKNVLLLEERARQNQAYTKEIEIYKALVDQAKDENYNLRETHHWFIGTCIGFILLILGSQIFYNVQLNTKKFEAIRETVTADIEKAKNELTESIKNDFKTLSKDHRVMIFEKFETYDTIRERKLKEMEADIEKLEAEIWLLKGVESNALTGYIRTVDTLLDLNKDVKYVLDDISKVLEKIDEIPEHAFTALEAMCKKVRAEVPLIHEIKLKIIEGLYKKKPVYRFSARDGLGLLAGLVPLSQMTYIRNAPKYKNPYKSTDEKESDEGDEAGK